MEIKPITVFFGPNNSGKSVTALTMYAMARLMLERSDVNSWSFIDQVPRYVTGIRRAGFSSLLGAMITQDKEMGEIRVTCAVKNREFDFTLEMRRTKPRMRRRDLSLTARPSLKQLNIALRRNKTDNKAELNHLYVPAARAGILQAFYPLMYLKNTILTDLEGLAVRGGGYFEISRLPLMLPHLEEFYDLLFRTLGDTDPAPVNHALNEVIGGEISIQRTEKSVIPTILYHDNSGFTTQLETAGSGIIELLPLLIFLDKIQPRGLLFVEEPEAHCEVRTQAKLIRLITRTCVSKKISSVLITHSDWVLYSLLSLVSQGELRRDQLAIYEFDRPEGMLTTVKEIEFDKRGKTEGLPPFEEVLSTLEKADLGAALR
jgi:hypothetical protein